MCRNLTIYTGIFGALPYASVGGQGASMPFLALVHDSAKPGLAAEAWDEIILKGSYPGGEGLVLDTHWVIKVTYS